VGSKTGIEWTDATWNPIRGCSRVSEGCRNCYAETVANRFCAPGSAYEGVVQIDAAGKGLGLWNGRIKFVEKRLLDPMHWKTPRKIFVNSMSDLFHENVTVEMLDRIFAVMALCRQHTFQILTKRPERMCDYLADPEVWGRIVAGMEAITRQLRWADKPVRPELAHALVTGMPLPNVWLGVSVENQRAADERIPFLLNTPAMVRFLSVEPLLGAIDLTNVMDRRKRKALKINTVEAKEANAAHKYLVQTLGANYPYSRLDWVIVGGESGPGARPMHPDWASNLRDQCVDAGVPFFFKQWGEWLPAMSDGPLVDGCQELNCSDAPVRVGKKKAGSLLDGVLWRQFPGQTR
jgi:protein gp37